MFKSLISTTKQTLNDFMIILSGHIERQRQTWKDGWEQVDKEVEEGL